MRQRSFIFLKGRFFVFLISAIAKVEALLQAVDCAWVMSELANVLSPAHGLFIVSSQAMNNNLFFFYFINQSICFCNSARPVSGEVKS